jgi:hypothetical protein
LTQPPYPSDPHGPGGYPPAGPPPQPGQFPPPQPGQHGPPPQPGQYGPPPQGQYGPPPQPVDGGFPPPPPGFPQFTPGAPAKKSNALKIVLIVLAVLVVLCAGAGVAIYFAVRDTVGTAVDNAEQAQKISLSAPETLGGRPKSDSTELTASAKEMEEQMRRDLTSATSTVGGFYGKPEDQNLVIAGAAGPNPFPDVTLKQFLAGVQTEVKLENVEDVEPGPLGGKARCGEGKEQDIQVSICVWSDAGSVGMITMYGKPVADLKNEFVALRGEIEKKAA